MSSVAQIAAGIATTINAATGLRTFDYVPDDLNPPLLFLNLNDIGRGAFARGQFELRFDAVLFVSSASDRAGQERSYAFSSWDSVESVWKALDATPGLGLGDTDAKVLRYRSLSVDEVAAYRYFGGAFEILVLTKGA